MGIHVFVTDDVILSEVAVCLQFYKNHTKFTRIIHAVLGAERNVDGLVLSAQLDLVIDGHFCRTLRHEPVF